MAGDRERRQTPPPAGALALPAVLAAMQEAVNVLEHGEIDTALLWAQLGDRCRDAGVEPVAPERFYAAVHELDAEGWRRLSALASQWAEPAVDPIVTAILRRRGAAPVLDATLDVVRAKPLLTMTLLRMSALRVEELARAWLGTLGIAIAGETAAQSAAALARLDYERLLAQAEQARQSAESRMAQLKKAQADDDLAHAPRRGKS